MWHHVTWQYYCEMVPLNKYSQAHPGEPRFTQLHPSQPGCTWSHPSEPGCTVALRCGAPGCTRAHLGAPSTPGCSGAHTQAHLSHAGVNPSKPELEKGTNFKFVLIPKTPWVNPSNSESVVFQKVAGKASESWALNCPLFRSSNGTVKRISLDPYLVDLIDIIKEL